MFFMKHLWATPEYLSIAKKNNLLEFSWSVTEVCLEPCETFKMQLFAKNEYCY